MLLYLFYALLVIVLLAVSFFSIEAWPFSAYPMFSNSRNHSFSSIFFIEIEHAGKKFKWKPKRSLLRKQIDAHLKSVLLNQNNNLNLSGQNARPDLLKKVVAHFYQLYSMENNMIKGLSRVNLIHQKVDKTGKVELPQPVISFTAEELNKLNGSS